MISLSSFQEWPPTFPISTLSTVANDIYQVERLRINTLCSWTKWLSPILRYLSNINWNFWPYVPVLNPDVHFRNTRNHLSLQCLKPIWNCSVTATLNYPSNLATRSLMLLMMTLFTPLIPLLSTTSANQWVSLTVYVQQVTTNLKRTNNIVAGVLFALTWKYSTLLEANGLSDPNATL